MAIPSGRTIRPEDLAEGEIYMRVGDDIVAVDLLATIQAAITDGSLPIILTAPDLSQYQLAVDNAGAMDNDSITP